MPCGRGPAGVLTVQYLCRPGGARKKHGRGAVFFSRRRRRGDFSIPIIALSCSLCLLSSGSGASWLARASFSRFRPDSFTALFSPPPPGLSRCFCPKNLTTFLLTSNVRVERAVKPGVCLEERAPCPRSTAPFSAALGGLPETVFITPLLSEQHPCRISACRNYGIILISSDIRGGATGKAENVRSWSDSGVRRPHAGRIRLQPQPVVTRSPKTIGTRGGSRGHEARVGVHVPAGVCPQRRIPQSAAPAAALDVAVAEGGSRQNVRVNLSARGSRIAPQDAVGYSWRAAPVIHPAPAASRCIAAERAIRQRW